MRFFLKLAGYLSILFSLAATAQQKGIIFQQSPSWQEILFQAQATNKYIFMDCYTTWCGPCKFMSKEIFPQEKSGNYFNDKFISVQVQMDTTDADNDNIKKWYADAHTIMQTYKVATFPTYLFFAPDGKLVHRASGAWPAPEDLINRAAAALDTSRQYYTLMEAYNSGHKDTTAIKYLALTALGFGDKAMAQKLGDEYIASLQDNVYTKENLDFINLFTSTTKDKGFNLFVHHPDKVNALMGKSYADERAVNIIIKEEGVIIRLFEQAVPPTANWNGLSAALKKKYPMAIVDRTIAWIKVPYHERRKEWLAYAENLDAYIAQYTPEIHPGLLNNYSWNLFENASDKEALAIALKWSKLAMAQRKEGSEYIDTYANLLYKTGDVQNAIAWEEKAVKINPNESSYAQTLEKMRKGEKTWEE